MKARQKQGFVYSFYSYKGGAGRSMALANVAVRLFARGLRVLVVDWDLEAPGLENYLCKLSPGVVDERSAKSGIVDLIERWRPAHATWAPLYAQWEAQDDEREAARTKLSAVSAAISKAESTVHRDSLEAEYDAAQRRFRELDAAIEASFEDGPPRPAFPAWKDSVIEVASGQGRIDFISAGKEDGSYATRLASLSWRSLFADDEVGLFLEHLREEWKDSYDVVLLDSRTGVSDIEGICTVLLPDALVLLFTAMRQSVDGVLGIWRDARRKRASLPVPRGRLLALPLPSRDEVDRENELGRLWHRKFAESFGDIYREWLPEHVLPLDAVKQFALPYVARWSFGEALPVVENEDDVRNPRSINAAYERVAALLVARFSWIEAFDKEQAPLPLEQALTSTEVPEQKLRAARYAVLASVILAALGAGIAISVTYQQAKERELLLKEENVSLAKERARVQGQLQKARQESSEAEKMHEADSQAQSDALSACASKLAEASKGLTETAALLDGARNNVSINAQRAQGALEEARRANDGAVAAFGMAQSAAERAAAASSEAARLGELSRLAQLRTVELQAQLERAVGVATEQGTALNACLQRVTEAQRMAADARQAQETASSNWAACRAAAERPPAPIQQKPLPP